MSHRYYVSYTFQTRTGPSIATLDITTPAPISTGDDLAPIRNLATRMGHSNVVILAFSPYAPAPQPSQPAHAERGRHDRTR